MALGFPYAEPISSSAELYVLGMENIGFSIGEHRTLTGMLQILRLHIPL